jgi:hypothetical protein
MHGNMAGCSTEYSQGQVRHDKCNITGKPKFSLGILQLGHKGDWRPHVHGHVLAAIEQPHEAALLDHIVR